MKSLTIRLPDALRRRIEEEARVRRVSVSDIVRERLLPTRGASARTSGMAELIGDLIGSVRGLPRDLSCRKKRYLSDLIRGKNHPRR